MQCSFELNLVQQYLILLDTANYRAVRCLILTTMNSERSSILLEHFMKSGQGNPHYLALLLPGCFMDSKLMN